MPAAHGLDWEAARGQYAALGQTRQVLLDTAPTLLENVPGGQGSFRFEDAEQLLPLQVLKYPGGAWTHMF